MKKNHKKRKKRKEQRIYHQTITLKESNPLDYLERDEQVIPIHNLSCLHIHRIEFRMQQVCRRDSDLDEIQFRTEQPGMQLEQTIPAIISLPRILMEQPLHTDICTHIGM